MYSNNNCEKVNVLKEYIVDKNIMSNLGRRDQKEEDSLIGNRFRSAQYPQN